MAGEQPSINNEKLAAEQHQHIPPDRTSSDLTLNDAKISKDASSISPKVDILDPTREARLTGNSLDNDTTEFIDPNALATNPLIARTDTEVMDDAAAFADRVGLGEYREVFRRGALLAKDSSPDRIESCSLFTAEEKLAILNETEQRWHQPKALYFMATISALAAMVQGMDETVVNGAQLFYFQEFNITDSWIKGLVNASPYLACFTIGCWLTSPMNNLFGRRGTIFITCFIAAAASIWEAFTYSWLQLFFARFALGLSIGTKSTTVPIYTAESSPAAIRGALTMLWQTFTAVGIFFGYVMDVAFINVGRDSYLNWRLMLGSTVVAPAIVCALVFFAPESPRWYVGKKRYGKAFEASMRLRNTPVQAARDLYYMQVCIDMEDRIKSGRNLYAELFTVPRNRRAVQAAGLLMFLQQFCGVNIIMYYSSQIFVDTGVSEDTAIYASLGAGAVNFLFAIPALYTIDTWGRRPLLLTSLPFMSLFLLFTGFSFWAPDQSVRLGLVAVGIYIYMALYSPGEGPVPFVYAAESFPLHVRDVGMSLCVAITWGFSFLLSLIWPSLLDAFKPQGAFAFFACWCFLGWIGVYFLVPETKGRTLEELDTVFAVPTSHFIAYQTRMLAWRLKHLLGKNGKTAEQMEEEFLATQRAPRQREP